MLTKFVGPALAAGTLAASHIASAASVVIPNGNFEETSISWPLADGGYIGSHERWIPGWSFSGGTGSGQWNPTAANFVDEAAHGLVGYAIGATGIEKTSSALGALTDIFLAANTRYTFNMDVGGTIARGRTTYDFRVLGIGSSGPYQTVFHSSGVTDPGTAEALAGGRFSNLTFSFETGAGDPMIGRRLALMLGSVDFDGTAYDNITLDVTTLGSGAVPEPSTWLTLILGFGIIGGAMRRRQSVRVAAFA